MYEINISKRAIRRHHYRRLKKKRQHYWRWPINNQVLTGASLGICTNTPANCDSLCCGNPRKHFGEKTIQEKKAEVALGNFGICIHPRMK